MIIDQLTIASAGVDDTCIVHLNIEGLCSYLSVFGEQQEGHHVGGHQTGTVREVWEGERQETSEAVSNVVAWGLALTVQVQRSSLFSVLRCFI